MSTKIIVVDYGLSLYQMRDLGSYDHMNPLVLEKYGFSFRDTGTVEFKAKPFYFKERVTGESVIQAMYAQEFRSARLEHLLTYGAQYPDQPEENWGIAAAGCWYVFPSIGWSTSINIPCIDIRNQKRYLTFQAVGEDGFNDTTFGPNSRLQFLGIKKIEEKGKDNE